MTSPKISAKAQEVIQRHAPRFNVETDKSLLIGEVVRLAAEVERLESKAENWSEWAKAELLRGSIATEPEARWFCEPCAPPRREVEE